MIIFTNYQIIEQVRKREGGFAIHEYNSSNTLGTHKEISIAQREVTLKWGHGIG